MKIWKVMSVLVVIALLYYIIRNINLMEIWVLVKQLNPLFLSLAILSYLAAFLVFNIRTIYAFSDIIKKPNFFFFLRVLFAGFFINIITPGMQIGGEPLRAHYIGKKYGKPTSKAFGIVLGDRFFHALVSIFFIFISVLFILTFISVSNELRVLFQAIFFFILGFFVLLALLNIKKTNSFITPLFGKIVSLKFFKKNFTKKFLSGKITKGMGSFKDSFKKTISTRRIIVSGISLSVVYWLLNYLVNYFLFLSLGSKVGLLTIIVAVSIGGIVSDFSPSPGGLGLVEGSIAFAYTLLGIDFQIALTVAILSRMILYFYSLLIGGLSLLSLNHSLR
ncbi:MAG TPA: flippase-like domain-containing protein [Candidatus Pacearchaeota archaeon]|nr:flippase-like domain-containing protein [Candidatus Pacearchaeota archaeon]